LTKKKRNAGQEFNLARHDANQLIGPEFKREKGPPTDSGPAVI
jgi:hypothetical protein